MNDERVRVWDPLIRIFHWSLVVLFAIAWFTGEEESQLHIWSGYAIIGLLVFRMVWGLVGTRHARFSDFLYSPRRTRQYLRGLVAGRPEHYTGHNPAGAWMIMLLLVSLALTSITGLQVYGLEGQGPLASGLPDTGIVTTARADEEYGEDGEDEEQWEEVHEFFANFTVLLIFLHVTGVAVGSVLHRENLVRAMVTGDKIVRRD